jgi:hypothetical protein
MNELDLNPVRKKPVIPNLLFGIEWHAGDFS